MKIVKLPVCYVRYLYAGYVVWYKGYYTDGNFTGILKRQLIMTTKKR